MDRIYREITFDELSAELKKRFGVSFSDATAEQLYFAISSLISGRLAERFSKNMQAHSNDKRVSYLSMEFLVGRNLEYNALATGLLSNIREVLIKKKSSFSFDEIADIETDPGLGNGGLGRLAACYMNSLSSLDFPATGYSILYKNGFFTQSIIDGEQIEKPDEWLKTGTIWLIPRENESLYVSIGGKVRESWENDRLKITTEGDERFRAVPYDLMIPGYATKTVNYIRLWKAEKIKSDSPTAELYREDDWGGDAISSTLYPSDDRVEGKLLRLSQQYFLVSATVKDIINRHKMVCGSLERFDELNAIHINDTHPALAIPELMRVLMDENGFSWDEAWRTVNTVFSYTNHTVMPEALETWNEDFFKLRLPRIYSIIKEINERVCRSIWVSFPGDFSRISAMAPVSYSRVRMAELCTASVHTVNGVSRIHSSILKKTVFRNYNEFSPEKFTSVTNGVSHIRWLLISNPALSSLITETIGNKFKREPEALEELIRYKNDRPFLDALMKIKKQNAERLFAQCGVRWDPEGVIDAQIKRFHEYKRQLMNALKILYVYVGIKDGKFLDLPRLAFVIGGKAAPGYRAAKLILKLIWNIGVLISSDKDADDRIRVLFAEDYSVSSAQRIIPATHISEQISLAGKEASGTGCMKMMMNGALTLGTPDGANLEISEAVGEDNAFIFGMDANEVERVSRDGYSPMKYYMQNDKVRIAVDALDLIPDKSVSEEIKRYLLFSGDHPDPYMCLRDFEPYCNVWERAVRESSDPSLFSKKSLFNIARSGYFSSDRAIREYAGKIWGLNRIR
ncbi:MAG: glycogen/starch/alpha-glucan phosphorylase [Clostridia bacterium]|nr:glycogen/starch/alpha-glucan phosphorylase [Clostridia bacterium]